MTEGTQRVFFHTARNMYGRDVPSGWFKATCTRMIKVDGRDVPCWAEAGPFSSEQEAWAAE